MSYVFAQPSPKPTPRPGLRKALQAVNAEISFYRQYTTYVKDATVVDLPVTAQDRLGIINEFFIELDNADGSLNDAYKNLSDNGKRAVVNTAKFLADLQKQAHQNHVSAIDSLITIFDDETTTPTTTN